MGELNPVVLSLYRAAYEIPLAEFQEAALRLVKPLVRFDGCKWGVSTIDEHGVLFQSVHYHEDDPGAADVYNEVRHEDRAAFWAIGHRGTTGNFHFIAKGYTHKEVARLLQLSPATIRNHIQTIHQRLGVATNAELVAIMMRAGY